VLGEHELAEGATVYYEVTGYERERAQGGTNALRLRQRSGRVACQLCVDRAARGVAPAQGSLLDSELPPVLDAGEAWLMWGGFRLSTWCARCGHSRFCRARLVGGPFLCLKCFQKVQENPRGWL